MMRIETKEEGKLSELEIEAFKKPTWQEYHDHLVANNYPTQLIEGIPIYEGVHKRVLKGDYSAPGLVVTNE